MGKLLIGIVALVIGVVVGAFAGASLGGGAMMGAGVATGLSAGICTTVKAAQDEGIMTPEQVDQVLARAIADAGGSVPEGELVSSAAQCEEALERLAAEG